MEQFIFKLYTIILSIKKKKLDWNKQKRIMGKKCNYDYLTK